MIKHATFLIVIIIAFLLLASTPIPGWAGFPAFVCESPIFIGVCALALVTLLVTFIGMRAYRKMSWNTLFHLTLILFALGAGLRMTTREASEPFRLYYNIPGYRIASVRLPNLPPDDNRKPLGFEIGCDSFMVDYYPSDSMLTSPKEKGYRGNLFFRDTDTASIQNFYFSTNHPVTYGDWRFYLLDYSTKEQCVAIMAVKDFGRLPILCGCVLSMILAFGVAGSKIAKLLPSPEKTDKAVNI